MRLLSELFPNFVKKSQSVRLDEGPFGAGVMKARMYLKPGEQPPQGAKVQSGPKGGRYYEDMGGGAQAPSVDEQGFDTAGPQPSLEERQARATQGPPQEKGEVEQFYSNVAAKQGELGRRLTSEEQQQVLVDTQAFAGSGTVDEQGFSTEGPQPSLEERQAVAQQGPPQGDESGPTFDGQGNVQLPGFDPMPVGEITGDLLQDSGLKEQYEAETGQSLGSASAFLDNYDGPLNSDSFGEHVWDTAGGQSFRSDEVNPAEYEVGGSGEDAMFDASPFFDWLGSKSGTETMKMAKMMQTYNVDNRRREPIVLTNKGGNQRRNAYVNGIYKK